MSDVDTLLWLHHIATQLAGIEREAEFEIAAIDDMDLLRTVAMDIYRFDGAARWADASTCERLRAIKIAEIAISSFLQQVLRSTS